MNLEQTVPNTDPATKAQKPTITKTIQLTSGSPLSDEALNQISNTVLIFSTSDLKDSTKNVEICGKIKATLTNGNANFTEIRVAKKCFLVLFANKEDTNKGLEILARDPKPFDEFKDIRKTNH